MKNNEERDGLAMIKKIVSKAMSLLTMSKNRRRMVIGSLFFPSVRRQFRLDEMVGPVGYWPQLQAYQIRALKQRGLLPQHRLLDIGCGPLQGGLAFIAYLDNGKYSGIDLREEAIAEAHTQVVRAGLVSKNPFLAVSETFGRDELDGRTFDYMWCSQLLYHLTETQIDALFEQVARRLTPAGMFYGDIIGYPNTVTDTLTWNGFRFHLHTVDALRVIAKRHGLCLQPRGQIEEYGYPSTINLRTNVLLEVSPAAAADPRP